MGRILICADSESLREPGLMGLEGCHLDDKDWLVGISESREAREFLGCNADIDEVWIASSNDLAGVNLAAALRKDMPELPIFMVAFNASGGELSRASQAGVTATLSGASFCARFEEEARRRKTMSAQGDVRTGGSQDYADVVEPEEPISEPSLEPRCAYPKFNEGAFVISYLSGSGGVGKSTVCAVSAYRAASMGFKTVVADCDLQFGDIHQVMGVPDAPSIDDVLADPNAISRLSDQTPSGTPALVRAPSRLERSEDLSKHLGDLLAICSSEFEVVLVNTGANWMESHAQLLENSAASVFLIDQRASSVHACRHALDLCMRLGIASASFVYALNRCKRGALFSSIDIANVLQGAHVVEIKDGGTEVEELLGAGRVSELAATRNDLCSSIDEMLIDLLPDHADSKRMSGRRLKEIPSVVSSGARRRHRRSSGRKVEARR